MEMSVTYTTVNGRLVQENRNGVITRYIPDTIGSIIQTRDASGNETSLTTYQPFGEIKSQTGTNPSPFGFCGTWGYLTDAPDRMYVRARTLRADLSRWTTVDPLWPKLPGYEYVANNPTSAEDYWGTKAGAVRKVNKRHRWPVLISTTDNGIDIANDLCGNGDPIACKGINMTLPPCTSSNPNWNYCGSNLIGPGGENANQSGWPQPVGQYFGTFCPSFCDWFGEYCCVECEMRVCCAFGPIQILPGPPTNISSPPRPIPPFQPPLDPGPGRPIPVPIGHSTVWS